MKEMSLEMSLQKVVAILLWSLACKEIFLKNRQLIKYWDVILSV